MNDRTTEETLCTLDTLIRDPSWSDGQRVAFALLTVAEALFGIASSFHQVVRSEATDMSYGIRDIVAAMDRRREEE